MTENLYQDVIIQSKDSYDGESCGMIYVTKESSGWAVFLSSYEGIWLVYFDRYSRDNAIRKAFQIRDSIIVKNFKKENISYLDFDFTGLTNYMKV